MSEQQLNQPEYPALSSEQLSFVADYVTRATDRQLSPTSYRAALERMAALSEQEGVDGTAGEVGVVAATIGAATRNQEVFQTSGVNMARRLRDELGVQKEHADIFWEMQKDFKDKSGSPVAIGKTLRSGLSYLRKREEQFGEDTSLARIAYLASGFSATQDTNLRRAIFKDLKSL